MEIWGDDAEISDRETVGGWNARQIVEHLVLTDETLALRRPADQISPDSFPFRMLPKRLRFDWIVRAMRRDRSLPLPNRDVDPTGTIPLAELWARWEAARGRMREEIRTARPDDIGYCHPIIGPLTTAEMLELDGVHAAYHLRQVRKLVGESV